MIDRNYDDMINMPCPTSPRHPRMPRADRAAQFAPFAALTGYDAAIDETGRLTDQKIDISEDMREKLDLEQNFLADIIDEQPEISVTYFVPDKKKSGGAYVTVNGRLKQIDEYEQLIILTDGKKIPIQEVYSIESDLFRGMLDRKSTRLNSSHQR